MNKIISIFLIISFSIIFIGCDRKSNVATKESNPRIDIVKHAYIDKEFDYSCVRVECDFWKDAKWSEENNQIKFYGIEPLADGSERSIEIYFSIINEYDVVVDDIILREKKIDKNSDHYDAILYYIYKYNVKDGYGDYKYNDNYHIPETIQVIK